MLSFRAFAIVCASAALSTSGAQAGSLSFTSFDLPLGATAGFATGINNQGDIVGFYDDFSVINVVNHGFERLPDGSLIAPVDNPNVTQNSRAAGTLPFAINDSGTIVGAFNPINGGTNQGFVLTGNSYATFSIPGSSSTSVFGINNNGDLAGSFVSAGTNNSGFIQIGNAAPITFNVSPGDDTQARGINSADQVVGSYENFGFIRDTDGTFTTVAFPGAIITSLDSINDFGIVAGVYQTSGGIDHGFYGVPGDLLTVDFPGAFSTNSVAINDSGTLVGTYYDSQGESHGFITSTTVPEIDPGSALSAVAILAGALAVTRGRK